MKILIIINFLLVLLLHSDELSWVDKQVNAIKPPRIGLKEEDIALLKDPFIFLHKKKLKKETNKEKVSYQYSSSKNISKHYKHTRYNKKVYFFLKVIMNKSAFINQKWYKVGDKIHGYRIKDIKFDSVILVKHHKKRVLSTYSKNKNLIFNK